MTPDASPMRPMGDSALALGESSRGTSNRARSGRRRCFLRLVAAALLATAGSAGGCALPIAGAKGTTHYVVVGFGVVSVKEVEKPAVVATDAHVLGLVVSDRPGLKFAVGYASGMVVTVPEGASDVRVQAARRPFGLVTIEVDSALIGQGAGFDGEGGEQTDPTRGTPSRSEGPAQQ